MITQEKKIHRSRPNFLLIIDAQPSGRWQCSLEPLDGGPSVEIADCEPTLRGERLELLTAIRGLEALDQPSRVTLVTTSRYVARGIRHGMETWRRDDWHWERFGELVPIKNHDLWARLDGILAVHEVRCKHYRLDPAHLRQSKKSRLTSATTCVGGDASAVEGGNEVGDSPSPLFNPPHFRSSARPRTDAACNTPGVLRALPSIVRELFGASRQLARSV